MQKLIIKLKLTYYNLQILWEDFVNKLNGRKTETSVDSVNAQIVRQHHNEKLRRGIKKLTKIIYGSDGKLQRWAKRKDVNLVNIVPGYKKTPLEKLEEAKIVEKTLKNPTDYTGKTDAMVKHNVKNAPRYVLERERRELSKEKMRALKEDDSIKVKILHEQIKQLNFKINSMKK